MEIDPFNFWLQEASRYCEKFGIDSVRAIEAISIIQNAFGREWIYEEIRRRKINYHPFANPGHPLTTYIETPGITQVYSLLELAGYLKTLWWIPRMPQVLTAMKQADHFESSWLQLAFGYRFHSIGASIFEFEPDADKGRKADFSFQAGAQFYMAECFVPRDSIGIWHSDLVRYSSEKVLKKAAEFKKRVIVLLTFKDAKNYSVKQKREIEAVLKRKIGEIHLGRELSGGETGWSYRIIETTSLTASEEQALFEKIETDLTTGYFESVVDKNHLADIVRGEKIKKKIGSRFLIKVPKQVFSLEEQVEELAEKTEKKLVQLRKKEKAAKGIVIVQTHLGIPKSENPAQLAQKLQKKLLEKHQNLAALVVVNRESTGKHRPGYWGQFICRETDPAKALLAKLLKFENECDFFKKN